MLSDDNNHFLETEAKVNALGQITFKHWNKNKGNEQEFYKGKHYNSIGPIQHKIGAVIGTFKRIDRNCSNIKLFQDAIEEKAQELILHLGYPKKLILNILYKLSITEWFTKHFEADKWLLPNLSRI